MPLTDLEIELIRLVCGARKLSDARIRAALGLDQDALLALAVGLKSQLGLPTWALLREHCRRAGGPLQVISVRS